MIHTYSIYTHDVATPIMSTTLTSFLQQAYIVPYYQVLWGKNKKLILEKELQNLPISGKELFNTEHLPDSCAVSEHDISYYFFSSGTCNQPHMIPVTAKEWEKRAQYRAERYQDCGVKPGDRVAILLPFGPWIAGPAVQAAIMKIGCTSFPIGLLNSKQEISGLVSIIEKHNIDTLITTPSLIENFIEVQKQAAQPVKSLKRIITSGEYLPTTLREQVNKLFGAKIYSSYGSSEGFIGIECDHANGFHFDPEKIIIETLNEKTLKPTPKTGIISITALESEAVPLVRYALGDLGSIDQSPCPCGSKLPRVMWKGRVNKNFVVAGAVNIYPYQIYEALAKAGVLINQCKIEITNISAGQDKLVFNIYTPQQTKNNTQLLNLINQHIGNMSIDFNDALSCKIVSTEIILKHKNFCTIGAKRKMLQIYDRRLYQR